MLIDTKPQGKHLVIKGMTQPLRDVFDITGFSNLFEFI
jgi:anti-anti-sigma regulatory factor